MRPRRCSLQFCATLSLTLVAAACSATGGGTGFVTDRIGRPVGPARIAYETDGGATAKLTVVTPDGEAFTGSAVSLSSETAPHVGFLVGKAKHQSNLFIDAGGKQWSGTIEAVLFGQSGRTMRCHLSEKRPGLGFEGGALGTCEVSSGQQIAVDL